jgi:YD repeat-containing protein
MNFRVSIYLAIKMCLRRVACWAMFVQLLAHTGLLSAKAANTHHIKLDKPSSQYLSASDSPAFAITGDLTIEGWVRDLTPFALNETRALLTKLELSGTGSYQSYSFKRHRSAGGESRLVVAITAAGNRGAELSQALNFDDSGTWNHYAMVFTAAGGQADLYVNGLAAGTLTGLPNSIAPSNVPLKIGASFEGQEFHHGGLDEVRLWAVARSADQIRSTMFRELRGNEAGLRGYWKMNGNLADSSAAGNTLDPIHAPTFDSRNIPFHDSFLPVERCPDANTQALFHLSDALDATPNLFHLTPTGPVTYSTGRVGNSADLGTANLGSALTSSSNFGISGGACTIGFWVKLNAEIQSGDWGLVHLGDGGSGTVLYIYYSHNGGNRQLRFHRARNNISFGMASHDVALGTNDFHFLTLTYDGQQIDGYLNGIRVATLTESGTSTANSFMQGFILGAARNYSNGAITDYASVSLDECFVLSRAMSAEEIRKHYGGIATARFAAASGDGSLLYLSLSGNWVAARTATNATQNYGTASTREGGVAGTRGNSSGDYVERGFFPFDTSSLPDNGIALLSAMLNLHIPLSASCPFYVTPQSQASPTNLTAADYSAVVLNDTPLFSDLISSPTLNTQNAILLSTNSFTAINSSGYTRLGTRSSHDVFGTGEGQAEFRTGASFSEAAAANVRPFLSVEYRAVSASVPDSDGDGMSDDYELANGLQLLVDDASSDLDGDGLSNLQEYTLNSLANQTDSDGDTLPDGVEWYFGTSVLFSDSDADGLTDMVEVNLLGTNPLLADSDLDGIPDGWETTHGLNPLIQDDRLDTDSDFLSNLEEYRIGTSPRLSDSNSDGTPDYRAVKGETTWQALYDKNDRLLGVRHERGATFAHAYDGNSNPVRQVKLGRDSDGDGMNDLWEFVHGLDPKSANGANGAGGDLDGDGWTNLQEYQSGSSPQQAADQPGVSGAIAAQISGILSSTGRYVLATGQMDNSGSDEVALGFDAGAGVSTNDVLVFENRLQGWTREEVPVGPYSVGSLAIGQVAGQEPAVYAGLRQPGGQGRVVQFLRSGSGWKTTVVAESLTPEAWVHGIAQVNGQNALQIGLSTPITPGQTLYRASWTEAGGWHLALVATNTTPNSVASVIPSGTTTHARIVFPLSDRSVRMAQPQLAYPSLDEFNDNILSTNTWASTTYSNGTGSSFGITESNGSLVLTSTWGSSSSSHDAQARVQTRVGWLASGQGLEIRIPQAHHTTPGGSPSGSAFVRIGTTHVFEVGPRASTSNVMLQLLRMQDQVAYRVKTGSNPWGNWSVCPYSPELTLNTNGRRGSSSSGAGTCSMTIDYARVFPLAKLLSAEPTAVDSLTANAAYRAATRSWFVRNTTSLPWSQAQLAAFANGGDLASLADPATAAWFPSAFPGESWLGLYRNSVSHPWRWLAEQPFTQASWAVGQPLSTPQHVYAFNNAGAWSSDTGASLKPSVMEFTTNQVSYASQVLPPVAAPPALHWPGRTLVQAGPLYRSLVADSVADWSTTGTQGERGWRSGYYNKTTDVGGVYAASDFLAFPWTPGPASASNFWNGVAWDWFSGNPPWLMLGQREGHPSGTNGAGQEHWAIRRWTSTLAGSLEVVSSLAKKDPDGAGTTMKVFHNGQPVESVAIAGNNLVGITRTNLIHNVAIGDQIDICLTPVGLSGDTQDNSDASYVSARIYQVRLNSNIASSLLHAELEDGNGNGMADSGDAFVLVERDLTGEFPSVRSTARRVLSTPAGPGRGLAVVQHPSGLHPMVATAAPDGLVNLWTADSPSGNLEARALTLEHFGKQWHGLETLHLPGGQEGLVGVAVGSGPSHDAELVVWSPQDLEQHAESGSLPLNAPTARLLTVQAAGGDYAQLLGRIWDAESHACRLDAQFKLPTTGTWSNATLYAVNGAPVPGGFALASHPTGITHTVVWNAGRDLGTAFSGIVLVRVQATDRYQPGNWSEPLAYRLTGSGADADQDGLVDAWESLHGLNVGIDDALDDADNDGGKNLLEFALGTDPQGGASLGVIRIEIAGGNPVAVVDRNPDASHLIYTLEASTNLEDWHTHQLPVQVIENTPARLTGRPAIATPLDQRVYMRLRVTRAP